MSIQAVLFVVAAVAGLMPVLAWGGRMGWRVAVALAVAMAAGAAAWSATARLQARVAADQRAAAAAPDATREGYATSGACRACHPEEYASWHATFHRTMTQRPTPETAVAPFDGTVLGTGGAAFTLGRSGDVLWARSGDRTRRVVLSTGSHHQQLFWLEGTERAVDLLPFNYLIEERRWVPTADVFLLPPGAPVQSRTGLWNGNCGNCHSVANQLRPTADGGADSRVAELGIACEACHGPAAAHVRAHANPIERYRRHLGADGDPTIVNPARLSPARGSQVCGQCHSVFVFRNPDEWRQTGARFRPGDDLADDRYLIAPRDGLLGPQPPPGFVEQHFWSDGMVRVSGREYSGLAASACFRKGGLACTSCHSMHGAPADDQLAPARSGDRACAPCHDRILAAVAEHTHHPADSAGSRCENCHMPYTTFGLLKAIRSHLIDSPDVATTVATGRPNACNLCHLDRTLAWSAAALRDWYGTPPPDLSADERTVAAGPLWLLRGDAGQRALAAWNAGWSDARAASGTAWMAPFLVPLLDDPYAAVRFNAWRSLRSLPGYAGLDYDYVAPRERRRQVADQATAIAMRQPRITPARAELLLTGDGGVDGAARQALLRQRDDRQVVLTE